MSNYKLTNFTTNTPKDAQSKLETGLKGVTGVDTVKLHPERSEFSLTYQESKKPKHESLDAACTKAGFTLMAPAAVAAKTAAKK